jgi:hypothetical protein
MNWRFAISIAVMFVMLFASGWLVHDGLLKADYDRIRPLLRPMEETRGKILYVFLAQLSAAAAFSWIYLRGVEAKGWIVQGVRYGIAVALLTTVPINFVQYAAMPLPLDFMLKRMSCDVIVVIAMGVVLAWINRAHPANQGTVR